MSFLSIAQQALGKTREVLKPTLKSDNKRYERTWWQELTGWKPTPDVQQKWDRRNANQEKVFDLLKKKTCVVVDGMKVVDAGKKMYDFAVASPSEWYGNCGEQALVALYLCTTFGALPEELWLSKFVKGTFAHELLLLVNNKKPDDPPACCDPWLNVACLYANYEVEADKRLKYWTGMNKRLPLAERIEGRELINLKWVEPSNRNILGFGDPKYLIKDAVNGNDTMST